MDCWILRSSLASQYSRRGSSRGVAASRQVSSEVLFRELGEETYPLTVAAVYGRSVKSSEASRDEIRKRKKCS